MEKTDFISNRFSQNNWFVLYLEENCIDIVENVISFVERLIFVDEPALYVNG